MGCTTTMIGHCEERKNYTEIFEMAGTKDSAKINKLLSMSVV